MVYANENFVFLHTAEEGKCPLHLPKECRLVEAFTGEEYCPERDLPKGRSYLYQII